MVGVAWPWARSRSSTLRREGSAIASQSCSSSDPGRTRRPASLLAGDIVPEASQVSLPSLLMDVDVAGLLLLGSVKRLEPALGHPQSGTASLGGEGELDQGGIALMRRLALWIVPAEGEPVRRLG